MNETKRGIIGRPGARASVVTSMTTITDLTRAAETEWLGL
ncbi:MAG: hypothetical protein ACJA2F_000322, partial [Nitriliruptoraceae bacterium]